MPRNLSDILKKADRLVNRLGSRSAVRAAEELGITLLYRDFQKQLGAYKVILRNRFIFLKSGMDPLMEEIVLWHEIGHDLLHRKEALRQGGFQEFQLFHIRDQRMEYEANLFAAEAMLPDEAILELSRKGFDSHQIAAELGSNSNLVALKVDALIFRGYSFRSQEHRSDFLKDGQRVPSS